MDHSDGTGEDADNEETACVGAEGTLPSSWCSREPKTDLKNKSLLKNSKKKPHLHRNYDK